MRMNMKTIIATIAATVLMFGGYTNAEDKAAAPSSESHDQHHPEGQSTENSQDSGMMGGGMMGKDMMGKMDMSQMKGMMHECMGMHKDGKMCDHQAMEKCQENMKKGDCQKMMKQAKAKEKVNKAKK